MHWGPRLGELLPVVARDSRAPLLREELAGRIKDLECGDTANVAADDVLLRRTVGERKAEAHFLRANKETDKCMHGRRVRNQCNWCCTTHAPQNRARLISALTPKYALNAASSLSLETKTILRPSFSAFSVKNLLKTGVKPRHLRSSCIALHGTGEQRQMRRLFCSPSKLYRNGRGDGQNISDRRRTQNAAHQDVTETGEVTAGTFPTVGARIMRHIDVR